MENTIEEVAPAGKFPDSAQEFNAEQQEQFRDLLGRTLMEFALEPLKQQDEILRVLRHNVTRNRGQILQLLTAQRDQEILAAQALAITTEEE